MKTSNQSGKKVPQAGMEGDTLETTQQKKGSAQSPGGKGSSQSLTGKQAGSSGRMPGGKGKGSSKGKL